jgi:mannosyltransferase
MGGQFPNSVKQKAFSKPASMKLCLLLLILLAAASLRIYRIGAESLWVDEIISIRQAQVPFLETISAVAMDVHVPFYYLVLNGWVHLFGISEFSTRLLSALFGTISVLLIYLVGKELFSEKVGLISALLLAIFPVGIFYSQEVRMYNLVVCLTLLSMWLLVRFIHSGKRRYLAANFAVSTALIYTHIYGFLVLFTQAVFLIFSDRRRSLKRDWLISEAAACMLFIAWVPTLIAQIKRSVQYAWLPIPTVKVVMGAVGEYLGGVIPASIFLALSIFFVMKYHKNLKAAIRLPWDEQMLVALWATVPLLIVLLASYIITPLFHVRYLLFMMPACLLLYAALISKLKPAYSYILIFLIIAACVSAVYSQAITTSKDDWRSVAIYLNNNVGRDDVVFLEPYYHQESLLYYYGRDCFRDYSVYSCGYLRHNILSIYHTETCCNSTTRLTNPDEKNRLASFSNRTEWLLSVRNELFQKNSLFTYLNNTKTLTLNDSIGDIKIYRFN